MESQHVVPFQTDSADGGLGFQTGMRSKYWHVNAHLSRPNLHVDTSRSNAWTKYTPGLCLVNVFRQALAVLGPERMLFGSDSSFFPRGWQHAVLGGTLPFQRIITLLRG